MDTLLNEKSLLKTIFNFHFLFCFTVLPSYLDTLYQCVGVEISYFMVYHMSKYLVYPARCRQLSGNYPKSHCDLLTLSLSWVLQTPVRHLPRVKLPCEQLPLRTVTLLGQVTIFLTPHARGATWSKSWPHVCV